ncbi:hypothetical protein BGW80DRAFT_1120980, partial [Lactifluus volemus]
SRLSYNLSRGHTLGSIVKFTPRYSINLRDFCARKICSPRILGFERLPGGWYCIAMEYL